MAISSVSLTYFSMVSTPSASTPVGGVAPAANDSPAPKKASCDDHEPRRRNVLFDAMMSALRELGLTRPATTGAAASTGTPPTSTSPSSPGAASPGAATADAANAATPPATSTPAPTLEDAVLSFAHALWQALRGDEGSRGRGGRHDDDDDHRRHHHHHGRHGRDYSGLASRIEALAVRIETTAPGATAPAPGATAPAAGAPVPAVAPRKLPGVDPVPMDAAAATAQTPPAAAVTSAAVGAAPASPAAPTAPAKGSLAEAFAAMLKLLRGGDQPASAPAPETSLANFLHSLARGLEADRSAPSMSVVGVMINVSA